MEAKDQENLRDSSNGNSIRVLLGKLIWLYEILGTLSLIYLIIDVDVLIKISTPEPPALLVNLFVWPTGVFVYLGALIYSIYLRAKGEPVLARKIRIASFWALGSMLLLFLLPALFFHAL